MKKASGGVAGCVTRTARRTVGSMTLRQRVDSDAGAAVGVEANARLTGSAAAVLFVLLALEGATVLEVGRLLGLHVFVGMLLLPPVVLKTLSTGYRIVHYYAGDPHYVRRGPPHPVLRVLGPIVVVLTFSVLITGVALLWGPSSWRHTALFLHKATFVLWFGAMTVHVVGHLVDTWRLAPRDWTPQSAPLPGAWLRRAALIVSVICGIGLGLLALGHVGTWMRDR